VGWSYVTAVPPELLKNAGKTSLHLLVGYISQRHCGRWHRAGTGQATLEVIGSKWSYALNWCKLNNDDDDDDDDDDDYHLASVQGHTKNFVSATFMHHTRLYRRRLNA